MVKSVMWKIEIQCKYSCNIEQMVILPTSVERLDYHNHQFATRRD